MTTEGKHDGVSACFLICSLWWCLVPSLVLPPGVGRKDALSGQTPLRPQVLNSMNMSSLCAFKDVLVKFRILRITEGILFMQKYPRPFLGNNDLGRLFFTKSAFLLRAKQYFSLSPFMKQLAEIKVL